MEFDSLILQADGERLGYGIVPTVSPATHAGYKLVVLTPAIEIVAAKLAALVRMNHHRCLGVKLPPGS